MSGFRDIAKGGWHPKGKDGKSKESWRGDFKGVNQVAGWLGKGKEANSDAQEHVSRPLSTLKDPASFGPPPKHYGAATPSSPTAAGLGTPLSHEAQTKRKVEEEETLPGAEEVPKPKAPPIPYRANTTGLSTSHLPPPPGRKDGKNQQPTATAAPKPPGLPPRLPPRQTSQPGSSNTSEAESHKEMLNQGSLSRLGAAGISVPGFGIVPKTQPAIPSSTPENSTHLNELQSRFSRLTPNSSKPGSAKEGTTFAEKQAALQTASSFRNNPSSVSFSDAKAAASTANNFRDRHGEQLKSGWQSANKLNTKYNIAGKANSFEAAAQIEAPPTASKQGGGVVQTELVEKKKPPPPPAKKIDLSRIGVLKEIAPPPIPMSSKPKPQGGGNYQ